MLWVAARSLNLFLVGYVCAQDCVCIQEKEEKSGERADNWNPFDDDFIFSCD